MNIKIKVNETQSKAVQEACFANNIKWCAGINVVQETTAPYIYIANSCIMYGVSDTTFTRETATEMNPEDFINKLNAGELK